MRPVILAIAAALPLLSGAAYIRSILKGKTQPERMTRLLLLVITALSTGALLAAGDTSGIWLAGASFVQALIVWLLALKRGIGGANTTDIICLALCFAGIGWWLVSGQSYIGLLASIVADFVAVVPALLKTIRLPHTELMLFYVLDAVAALMVLTVGPYSWRAALFPLYILVINMVFALAIGIPRANADRRSV